MDTIQRAKQILAESEMSLRRLIEEALRAQQYSIVAELAVLAEGVAKLLTGHNLAPRPQSNSVSAIETRKLAKTATLRKRQFPYFEKEADRLIKVGWSKKNKAEYEHRATKETVVTVVRHLLACVADGKTFQADDVLPVPDIPNNGEIPSYQFYLTLAWLRSMDVLAKQSSDGYILRHSNLDEVNLEQLWAHLPIRARRTTNNEQR